MPSNSSEKKTKNMKRNLLKKLEISALNLGKTSKTLKQQRKEREKNMVFKKSLNSSTKA